MPCDVASGFNLEHFLHLNRADCRKRKSHSPLYITINNAMEKVWLACIQRYSVNLSCERMLRHQSTLKKGVLSFTEKKKELRLR